MRVDFKTLVKPVTNNKDKFPFGIRLYCAYMGGGKTLSMIYDTYNLLEKYDDLYIISNIKFKNIKNVQYFQSVDDLLKLIDVNKKNKHVLVLIDEGLSYFAENGGIDPALLSSITHSRKNKFYFCISTQIYVRINNRLRDFANETVMCKNVKNLQVNVVRDESTVRYDKTLMDYVGEKKYTYIFKRNNELYNSYDTFQNIDVTKNVCNNLVNRTLSAVLLQDNFNNRKVKK